MFINRLILFKLNPVNKSGFKSLFSINNVLSVNLADANQLNKSSFLSNRRNYSDITAATAPTSGKDASKQAMPEMEKSLKEMEKNVTKVKETLNDPIAVRQANFKLSYVDFLEKKEKPKKNNKFYDDYVDPYVKLLRLNNLAPVHLVYWPSAWAILGSASYLQTTPDYYMLGLFALGAVSMRTAGCIVNDIWDRNIDKQVERTKDRPLASGKVGLFPATLLLGANLSVSLAVLMQLNLTTQVLGACALFPVAIYPAAKRFTNWPQAILGVTFNWGVLLGWSGVICSSSEVQSLNLLAFLPAFVLYTGCINWTLFYDTIYAFQDKEHDEKMGLKSTAILLQKNPTLWLLGFSTLCSSNLALFGWLTSQEPIYYITVGAAMLHFLKQIIMVDYKSPKSCMSQFKSNTAIGYLVAFGLLASIYIK